MMSDSLTPSQAPRPQEAHFRRALRISAQDIPALFSEGLEEEVRPAERSRVRTVWPALLEKLSERTKTVFQS
jgi:hypothetical protein